MSERYLYEIRPVRPISIPGKPKMRQSTCALLTKEEVLEYMKYGAIYRKYADPNMAPVKVTGENIGLLHRDPKSPIPAKPTPKVVESTLVEVKAAEVVEEKVEPKKEKEEESTPVIVADDSSEVEESAEEIVEATEEETEEVEEEVVETVEEEIETEEVEELDETLVEEETPDTGDALEETNDGADVVVEAETTQSEATEEVEDDLDVEETEDQEEAESDNRVDSDPTIEDTVVDAHKQSTEGSKNYNNYKGKNNKNQIQFTSNKKKNN